MMSRGASSYLAAYAITASVPERAMMEALYLVPVKESFEEAGLLMEDLTTVRPRLVQSLLEQCRLVRVTRLFMFLAEACNHAWVKKLDPSKMVRHRQTHDHQRWAVGYHIQYYRPQHESEMEGITGKIRTAFVICRARHDRPMDELLAPNLKDFRHLFEQEFAGMTDKKLGTRSWWQPVMGLSKQSTTQ